MAKKDKTKLEPRLPAGAIDGLEQDAGVLAEKTSGSVTARAQKKASTQKQNVTGAQVRRRVMALRSALQRTGAEAGLMKIIAAAELEFVEDNPERLKQYQALVPSKPKKKPAPQ